MNKQPNNFNTTILSCVSLMTSLGKMTPILVELKHLFQLISDYCKYSSIWLYTII